MNEKEFQFDLTKFNRIYVAELRKAMGIAEDWQYRSVSTTSDDLVKLIEIAGEENFRYVSRTRYPNGIERFSAFIGPVGVERCKEYKGKTNG